MFISLKNSLYFHLFAVSFIILQKHQTPSVHTQFFYYIIPYFLIKFKIVSYLIRVSLGYENGKHIEKSMTWTPDDKMTKRQIQIYINSLAQNGANMKNGAPLSQKTIKNYLGFISGVLNYAVKMEMLQPFQERSDTATPERLSTSTLICSKPQEQKPRKPWKKHLVLTALKKILQVRTNIK